MYTLWYRVIHNDWKTVWASYSGQNIRSAMEEGHFFQWDPNILKLCFQKSQEGFCIFQIRQELWCSNLKICKMYWKLRIKQTSILFCKCLRNESLDLYEILNLSSQDSSWPPQNILWRSVYKWLLYAFMHWSL